MDKYSFETALLEMIRTMFRSENGVDGETFAKLAELRDACAGSHDGLGMEITDIMRTIEAADGSFYIPGSDGESDYEPGDSLLKLVLDIQWAAENLLSPTQYADFNAQHVALYADFNAKRSALDADFDAQHVALYADFNAKHVALYADVNAKRAILFMEIVKE